MLEGLVVKNTGSWYVVAASDGNSYNCKIKGTFRLKGIRSTNPVAVGDKVELLVNPDQSAFIITIKPRTNYIIRKASNLSKESHILGANLDLTILVATLASPVTSTIFIDRFLATAMAYRVPATIVLNKVDLLTEEEDREFLAAVKYLYESIGYKVICTSTVTGEGIDELKEELKDKTTLFSGNSGVGKSSIINELLPDAVQKVGDVSASHNTGMHTTTYSEMFELPSGGRIIDTPGIKGFGTIDFEKQEVSHYFPEIFEVSKNCRYGDCTHIHEPGCAVLQAVENHEISESRYASYLSIIDDENNEKYRKGY